MFFAAPMPTGIERAMPTTVETTVIQRLSAMPSTISSWRLRKSGGKDARTKLMPRGMPTRTRTQVTGVVGKTSTRYSATPSAKPQRSHGDLIRGGFFQRRGRATDVIVGLLLRLTVLRQPRQAVAIQTWRCKG